jgi:hypothetical protein
MMTWEHPKFDLDADPVMRALRELVKQIESSSYFDQGGHLLELNPAYVEARDLVHGYVS